jgi:hypothetical protein
MMITNSYKIKFRVRKNFTFFEVIILQKYGDREGNDCLRSNSRHPGRSVPIRGRIHRIRLPYTEAIRAALSQYARLTGEAFENHTVWDISHIHAWI